MSVWVWSDTHFGHRGIIDYCKRPYADVDAMNRGLIDRWNEWVKPTDTIYHLGDFGFGKDLADIFAALNGHKHLVRGNHDYKNPAVLKLPWESQHDLVTIKENGVRLIGCHYPLETWASAHHGYLHAHGHSHGTLKHKIGHRWDVGADVEVFPVSLAELAERAKSEEFVATDHHGDL